MGEIKIGQFQLGEFATLAEQIAKQKALDKDTDAAMKAEALRLQAELAEALFAPYVGKRIRGSYSSVYTLFRQKHYSGPVEHLFAFDATKPGYGSQPGAVPDQFSVKGWIVHVTWNAKHQRMLASLTQEKDRADTATEGGDGDLGTKPSDWRACYRAGGRTLILEADVPILRRPVGGQRHGRL
jgi:hypothetical protein